MASEFKVGDIVRLVTGGPEVVVVSVRRTPGGTVMIGCAPLAQPDIRRVYVAAGHLAMMN